MSYNQFVAIGTKILEEANSKVNGRIKVIKSLGLGTYIQVEDLTQSGGVVENVWRFALKRVELLLPFPKRILILGLGGGSAAVLARKVWPEAKIVGVDIDETMVNLGKKYLGLGEADIKTKIEDAENFVAQSRHKYDLILVDTYLGYNFPEKFEKKEFLENIHNHLSKSGLAVFNRLYFDNYRSLAIKFGQKLEKVFPRVDYIYPEANIMFLCFA